MENIHFSSSQIPTVSLNLQKISINMSIAIKSILFAFTSIFFAFDVMAKNQTIAQSIPNPSASFTKNFEPIAQRVDINCGSRQYVFNNDKKNKRFEFSVIAQEKAATYPFSKSDLADLIWDKSRFDSITYLCRERGLILFVEGYQYLKSDGLLMAAKTFHISNSGEITASENTAEHANLLALANRTASIHLVDNEAPISYHTAKLHGPWQPLKIETTQTIQCGDRQFSLSYLPFYRNLNFTSMANSEIQKRDLSSSPLQKIFENRSFFFRSSYGCIDNGFSLRFQGFIETDQNSVEPLTITLAQGLFGTTLDYEQRNELTVEEDLPALRGEVQFKKNIWKTTRQLVKENQPRLFKPVLGNKS